MKAPDVNQTPREYLRDRRRRTLKCDICPPHRGENAGRWVKHGEQKPRKRWKRSA